MPQGFEIISKHCFNFLAFDKTTNKMPALIL
jgi:hypothetical protein